MESSIPAPACAIDSGSSASTSLPPKAKAVSAAAKWEKPNGPPVGSTFGARLLKEDDDVFDHNAWDHAELPDDFKERAEEIMERHRASPVSAELREGYNAKPASYWNKFYASHKDQFFKDRAWLRLEYPELIACSEADVGPKTVLEVGCGAGNTVFPVLNHNENPELVIYATDYSSKAVDVVKSNPMYPKPPHGRGILHASVWDITSKPDPSSSTTYSLPEGLTPNSVDVITVIYVLSALHPEEWKQAIHNLWTVRPPFLLPSQCRNTCLPLLIQALKPNGHLLIRDYGRHDLAQLRIKKDRLLQENLYIRGDGTRVYFFEKHELETMLVENDDTTGKSMFVVDQLGEDRRLLVNRKKRITMFRIWLQVKARKVV
ncbi:hypothetical protein P7C73_g1250, partial [Tremellales sp. Uapishka_1]